MTDTTCQICARQVEANTGRVAHHGYTRPGWGYQTGSCKGALAPPYEADRAALAAHITYLGQAVASLTTDLAQIQAEEVPAVVTYDVHSFGNRQTKFLQVTRATFDEVRDANAGVFLRRSLFNFDEVKSAVYAHLEQQLRAVEHDLADAQGRHDAWTQVLAWVDGAWVVT